MRRFLSVLLLVTITVSMLAGSYVLPASAYDMNNISSYAGSEVEVSNRLGFIAENQSYADMRLPVTRMSAAQIAVLIYKKLTGIHPEAKNINRFDDCHDKNVALAAELGIMSGRGDGIFAPQDPLTRQEMAKVFINILTACKTKIPSFDTKKVLADFSDKDSVADWAKDALALLIKGGIMKGDSGYIYPSESITLEQAYIMAGRFYNTYAVATKKTVFAKPELALPEDNSRLGESAKVLSIGWTNETVADKYAVYIYYLDDNSASFDLKIETTNTFVQVPVFNFEEGNRYAIRIGAFYTDATYEVFSDTHVFSYGEEVVVTEAPIATPAPTKAPVVIVPSTEAPVVTAPPTEAPVATPAPAVSETTQWGKMTYDEKFSYIFPQGKPFETVDEAKVSMTTINVPVWRLNNDGTKTSSTMEITVHHMLAEVFYKIFEEIFNDAEKFPFKDAGAYNWRNETIGANMLSHHNYGTAIDLNYNSNYCIYSNGSIVGDHWLPGEDPYSFPKDGIVVRTFAKYGFKWGGEWNSTKDYMHFSFLEG